MDGPVIKRVLVWSGWLRTSHASIGLAVLVLLFTGWLIAESPSLAESALELHYLASGFLIFGLVVRIVLMFSGMEHERLPGLFPASSELYAMAKTFRFYVSLGKSPMPGWYAQNPLWKPFYLVIYLALIVLVISGAVMPDSSLMLGFYLPSVHTFWAQLVFWFTVLHISSVVMHDYKNKTADISAMVNGYRLFLIDSNRAGSVAKKTIQHISIDSLKKNE
jgi:Ni/Fe-hydrogenase 1 B-type cytochrome subunit